MLISLEQKTLPEFELGLLEVAVKGSKFFLEFYKKHSGKWDINMHVLWHEFSGDFEHLDKQNNIGPLMNRARDVVSKLSSRENSLHERALRIYLHIMQISRAASGEEIKEDNYSRDRWSANFPEGEPDHWLEDERLTSYRAEGQAQLSIEREEGAPYGIRGCCYDEWEKTRPADIKPNFGLRPCQKSRVSTMIKEKEIDSIEDSIAKRASSESLCDLRDDELLIFEKPKNSDDDITKPKGTEDGATPGYLSISENNLEGNPGQPDQDGPVLSIDDDDILRQPGSSPCFSQQALKLEDESNRLQQSNINLLHDQKVEHVDHVVLINEDSDIDSDVPSNADYKSTRAVVLEKFPGDFNGPIEWIVDKTKYSAKNIDNLRSAHDVLIEGVFGKLCKGNRWRWYHGFLLFIGVMVYFRKENKKMVFKKAADFRNSRVTIVNNKSLKVITKERDFLLQFKKQKNCDVWYETILGISAGSLDMCSLFSL